MVLIIIVRKYRISIVILYNYGDGSINRRDQASLKVPLPDLPSFDGYSFGTLPELI